MKPSIICDTTLWLYLGRIRRIELLSSLFTPIYLSEAVLLELDMGRFLRSDTLDPRALSWAVSVHVTQKDLERLPINRLGTGERTTIAYAYTHPDVLVGLDDFRARQLAESLGLRVTGTPGVLLRAKRAGLLAAIRPELEALISQGFRLSSDLYVYVLKLAEEA
ncbi:MAG: DUF3368 domain-containing protein [Anaerolineae bacterium]|nr:DUF3368 domain-containing protein [Anaerolineae bacterium]